MPWPSGSCRSLAFARARGDPRSRLAILHWVASGLALLGHATAFHILAATAAWSVVRFRSDGLTGLSLLRAVAWWHFVPLAATAALEVGFWGRMSIGGGPSGRHCRWSAASSRTRSGSRFRWERRPSSAPESRSSPVASSCSAALAAINGLLSRRHRRVPTATFLLQHGTLQFERATISSRRPWLLQLTARVLALPPGRRAGLASSPPPWRRPCFSAGQAPAWSA